MPTATLELTERWRTHAGQDNPAGPLFSGGPYAETELVAVMDTRTCSACTASRTSHCC